MDQKVIVSVDTYSNYLDAMLRMSLLRDVLSVTPEYNWEFIIRVMLDIPNKEEKNEP